MSKPTTEDNDELLLSCRYGDLDDLKAYVDKFGADSLSEIRDDNGNTILHMTSANGHIGERNCASYRGNLTQERRLFFALRCPGLPAAARRFQFALRAKSRPVDGAPLGCAQSTPRHREKARRAPARARRQLDRHPKREREISIDGGGVGGLERGRCLVGGEDELEHWCGG